MGGGEGRGEEGEGGGGVKNIYQHETFSRQLLVHKVFSTSNENGLKSGSGDPYHTFYFDADPDPKLTY